MDLTETIDLDLVYQNQFISDDEDEPAADDVAMSPECFRRLAMRSEGVAPLAFAVHDGIPQRDLSGVSLTWTNEGMAVFAAIRKIARSSLSEELRNFPFAFLRGAVEVSFPNVLRLDREMGLGWYALDNFGRPGAAESQPFAYLEASPVQELERRLRVVLSNWITDNLTPKYAVPGRVDDRLIAKLDTLLEEGGLVRITPFASRAMPWPWNEATGTTFAPQESYRALTDLAAKEIAGKEIFPGLGPMRRLISASGRSNSVELVTAPISLGERGEHGRMSLVATLRVETVPSLRQPLLILDVSKRRWIEKLKQDTFDQGHIRGAVFSDLHRDRAFSFYVARRRQIDGGDWGVDNSFEPIRRALELPLTASDAVAIIRGDADTKTAKAFLLHRPGISGDSPQIQAGVPERDKLEGFFAASKILGELGLRPFGALTPIEVKHRKTHEAGARMANASTLLSAMLEAGSSKASGPVLVSSDYLQKLPDKALNDVLLAQFTVGIAQMFQAPKLLLRTTDKASAKVTAKALQQQATTLQELVKANREALRSMFGDELPPLVLFHEEGPGAEIDRRLLEAAIRLLWGDFPLIQNRLPSGTHGPKSKLSPLTANGKQPPLAARSAQRIDAWRSVTDQIQASRRRHLCLVMASLYYSDPETGKSQRDDRVNKPSTRKALAGAGCSVQFLLPPVRTKKGELNVADFLMRVQAAMKDLVSAHWGRVDKVASIVEESFPDPKTRPREVIGITIVRKQGGRANRIDASFLPVAIRIDTATGRCFLRYAYESAKALKISSWEPFSDALSQIASMPPVKLAAEPSERKSRFMRFVQEVISQSVDEENQPVVLLDSSNAVHLWPWLADVRMNASNIDIGEREFMHEEWAGARIIRIRQDLTPSILDEKYIDLAETTEEDARPCKKLIVERTVPVPTSPSGGLFRVGEHTPAGCVAYFSVGRKLLHKNKRGLSCYRPMSLPEKRMRDKKVVKNKADKPVLGLVSRDPFIDQWPSPNAIEIVVTLRQAGDNPDLLASFVERLRYGFGHYGEWTSLPAPLFFERVVRDYISHFHIEDADDDEEGSEA